MCYGNAGSGQELRNVGFFRLQKRQGKDSPLGLPESNAALQTPKS